MKAVKFVNIPVLSEEIVRGTLALIGDCWLPSSMNRYYFDACSPNLDQFQGLILVLSIKW